MKYIKLAVIEAVLISAILFILYDTLPAAEEPLFRPYNILEAYNLHNEVYKQPYTNKNPPSRSFEEPDYGLLSSPPPSSHTCNTEQTPKLFIGIFSTPEKSDRRSLIRTLMSNYFDRIDKSILDYSFIVAQSSDNTENEEILKESERFADIMSLDIPENMDNGKTFHFYKHLHQLHAKNETFQPQFVTKCDDDTMLVIPALLNSLKELDCNQNIYWGTSAGRSQHFPEYFRGLAYILSWPLVKWIGNSDISTLHQQGIEDARTGQWMQSLNYIYPKQSLKRVDNLWDMGDWNQLALKESTLALHWQHFRLKLPEWWVKQAQLIDQAWKPDSEMGQWHWQGSYSPDDEKKERYRLAIMDRNSAREKAESAGETFDEELYNEQHPEVNDSV
ncbi:hypothetical protein E3Q22_01011 [Wallemia mellicola]|uniref:Hexosyltransferase n=2 Tax=Wallemia mellicola TaxID=1708541 RepID=A0A4T0TW57_9BASI|nr:hypothetical protein WALSEDRAFT_56136 [Wallemia mellicola CBS 633.66]TIB74225.1 hypothetical protein E3Q24_00701 [Wallemia mellicola]EIM23543.1 hypothetical protein WALSEDRAFT_56136 [Wallemia mellicola CBS 633.66]TIB78759.1 hypothetical protein E3Q23_00617 [Wallemia mellicola]TIB81531.1 hypothetical protein E3Q22_01011 [Wallemia mellicola]TIB90521.1 hypothetical protein E3Q21_00235 [Wallemia mellicola]|eukprot:XP_006956220.1 hypothetical protein WALSEDRAFT_56136 [Wallemia mellicola CBS 633.66]